MGGSFVARPVLAGVSFRGFALEIGRWRLTIQTMRKFAILLLLLTTATHCARAQRTGLTAELQLDQDQFLSDEDVPLKVRIINRSGQPVVLGTAKQWITFDVVGEHDYVVAKLGEMQVQSPFTLLSGQAVTREFNPTPYFGYRRMGRYRLGAIIKVPQWKQEVACKPVAFTISEGLPLPDLGDLSVGVPPPPGATNTAPEMRHYSLVRVSSLNEVHLYFRLTDDHGQALRVYPLGRTVDFGRPEVQLDSANNLNVLFQTGAHVLTYAVIDPNGSMLARQYHEFTQTRPSLRLGDDGRVVVGGGHRVPTLNDLPAAAPATAKSQ